MLELFNITNKKDKTIASALDVSLRLDLCELVSFGWCVNVIVVVNR